jgi:hypothetical protein
VDQRWQRGGNENTNLLLRQYFPEGMDTSSFGQAELSATARQLNVRPKAEAGLYDIGPASDCKGLAKRQFLEPQDTMLSRQNSS